MADNHEVINIEIDSSKAFDKLAELDKSINEINDSLKQNTKEDAESVRQYERDLAVKKDLIRQQRELRKQLENQVRQQTQNQTSLKAMRAQLSNLRQTYDELAKAEREGDIGQALQAQITQVNDALLAAEEATGRYQRNVGNYLGKVSEALQQNAGLFGLFGVTATDAVKKAGEGFDSMSEKLKGVVNGFKQGEGAAGKFKLALNALVAHPIILVITAVVALLVKIWQTVQKSEEMTNRLKVSFSEFQPVLDFIENGFEALAETLVTTIELFAGAAAKLMDFVGVQNAAGQSTMEYIQIQKDKIALEQSDRDAALANAEAQNKIAKLKAQIASKEKTDRAGARKDLLMVIQLERQMADNEITRAKERLRLAEEEAKKRNNDKAANEELIKLRAEVTNADTAYFNKMREINSKLADFDKQTQEERKRAAEAEKQRLKALADAKANSAAEEQKRLAEEIAARQKAYQDELAARKKADAEFLKLIKERGDKEFAELDRQNKLKIATLKANKEAFNMTDAQIDEVAFNQRKERNVKMLAELAAQMAELEKRRQSGELADMQLYEEQKAQLQASMTDALIEQQEIKAEAETKIERAKQEAKMSLQRQADALAQTSLGKTKAGMAMQKTLAMAQVAMNAGKAISEAVASASSGDPYTIALRIAAAVTAVTVAIAKATDAISGAGFATGGTVRGSGTGTSDSIPIRVSNGEAIMNARAVQMFAPMLSQMNQVAGGAPITAVNSGSSVNNSDFIGRQMAMAVAGIQPVVSVTDFIDASNRLNSVKIASRVN